MTMSRSPKLSQLYDPHCYELAEYFLADEPGMNIDDAKHHLAIEIQQVIEKEIEAMREIWPKEE
jgi:hypothetical protein